MSILIAPKVLEKCLRKLKTTGELKIGDLTISTSKLSKKGFTGTKVLPIEEYGDTKIAAGRTTVYTNKNKVFYSTTLTTINSPLIQPVMDLIFGVDRD